MCVQVSIHRASRPRTLTLPEYKFLRTELLSPPSIELIDGAAVDDVSLDYLKPKSLNISASH